VFSISLLARFGLGLGIIAGAACAGVNRKPDAPPTRPLVFYTVTAELALARGEPRVAALQYGAAADLDQTLWPRAVAVATLGLQPDLALAGADRWSRADPGALEPHRLAADAALDLHDIPLAEREYRFVVTNSADGTALELGRLEKTLRAADNIYGARQVADRLAKNLPASAAMSRLRGFTALRADDPASAAVDFAAALAAGDDSDPDGEVKRASRRARVLAGDVDAPLAESLADVKSDPSVNNRFDYAVLLWSAKRNGPAREQLESLLTEAQARADALRVLGLMAYDVGDDATAEVRFTELLGSGAYTDDAFYYLGLIADRHADIERALRSYARIQDGDKLVPAMLRAAVILYRHGEEAQADELLDRLLRDQREHAPEIIAARADLYAQAGHPDLALGLLNQAVLQYPVNVDLRYARATLDEQLGHVDAAIQELEALLRARPRDPAAMNALGYTLADHSRQLKRASELIERAYGEAPKSAAIRDSLGWVYYRQGRPEAALPMLEAAFADEPGGDIGAHLGEVLWKLDQRSEAERVWTEARRIEHDNRLLESTRQRLTSGESRQ
jgi:predicted Zn-dependent protease